MASSLAARCCRSSPAKFLLERRTFASKNTRRWSSSFRPFSSSGWSETVWRTTPALGAIGCLVFGYQLMKNKRLAAAELTAEQLKPPRRADLPIFTRSQVSEHNCPEKKVWVTFADGVYDITDFVSVHPGGAEKIRLASGGPLEPFWALYAVHKTPEVLEILEEMRIGTLDASEAAKVKLDENDPYSSDPQRHPALMACSKKPFNAETPPELLTHSFQTPNELFFVRNHLPVPEVDLASYSLEIGGENLPTKRYTLDELKRRFPPVKINATLQCAGNRRNELNTIKPVKGLTWNTTAISNAEWEGVRLSDVLKDAGVNEQTATKFKWEHVQFEGLDKDPTGQKYGASIVFDKAMDTKGDVILAYHMNGQPLPRDHGFPLRVIAPGIVGARNVKWLSKIHVSQSESGSHWQQNDYKSFSPSTDWDTVDFKSAPAIQDAPIQSAICSPTKDQRLPKSSTEVEVRGYAWSGGGRGVVRVDVSADGGKTWKVATLQQDTTQNQFRMWAWSLWSCTLPIASDQRKVELVCKATDVAYNVQPDGISGIWNLRGVLNNAWHRVTVTRDD